MTENPKIAVVGCGRVGSFLVRNAKRRQLDVILAVQNRESIPADLDVPVVGIFPTSKDTIPQDRDVIFIATTEPSFSDVCGQLRDQGCLDTGRKQPVIAHMSGAYPGSYLVDFAIGAHRAASFHPIHPFRSRQNSPDSKDITVALDGQPDTLELLERVANHLEMTTVVIPAEQRSLYHLACVLAANHVVTLAHHAGRIASDISANDPNMNRAILHLMRASLDNLEACASTNEALTGPVSRGHLETLRRHEQALREHYPDLRPFYRTMVEATLPLVSKDTAEKLAPFFKTTDGDLP